MAFWRRHLGQVFEIGLLFGLLTFCLYGGSTSIFVGISRKVHLDSVLSDIAGACQDPSTQWLMMLCGGTYLGAFTWLRFCHRQIDTLRLSNPSVWLVFGLALNVLNYALRYSTASKTTLALALLAIPAVGSGIGWRQMINRNSSLKTVIFILLILFGAVCVFDPAGAGQYQYQEMDRSRGPWESPNIFGLLMGAGMVLSAGQLMVQGLLRAEFGVPRLKAIRVNLSKEWPRYLEIIMCLAAAIFMGRALLHSYSRGAWVGSGAGLVYLTCKVFSFQFSSFGKLLRKHVLPLSIIVSSAFIVTFWQYRRTEWSPARRAFSVANQDDFSWLNRVSAWEGALQLMAEHPWFGAGWNRPGPFYERFYLSSRLNESSAIERNDWLMIGAAIGTPALFCFVMYVWLSLTQSAGCAVRNEERADCRNVDHRMSEDIGEKLRDRERLKIVCRAGAMVLLVGFWFDGGLFELATGSVFWILLELGREDLPIGARG
jgi:hypothetical protein